MQEELMNYPVGYTNFGQIIRAEDTYVDKTLLVKELFDKAAQVTLITRPRRFGKTSNLSMLQHFLADEVYGSMTEGLFNGLKIDQIEGEYVQKHQGQYPVIFLTLKGIKCSDFDSAINSFSVLISALYREHRYLLDSPRLISQDRAKIESLISGCSDQAILADSLKSLTTYLKDHHQKNVWILIDEYDTPLIEGYINGYWEDLSRFFGKFLTAALKDNPALDRSVITGITRIGRENLFSDLNHVKVCTVLDDRYSQYFGFTEEEVTQLLDEAEFDLSAEAIKGWYNGYHFGNRLIYNPWSIINCLNEDGKLEPYWVNTSENSLIRKLVSRLPLTTLDALFEIARGGQADAELNDTLSMPALEHDPKAVWTLMVMTGYLNAQVDPSVFQGRDTLSIPVQLSLPNKEVFLFFKDMIQGWLIPAQEIVSRYNPLLDLLNKDYAGFKDKFASLLLNLVSHHDATRMTQESFYHGLLLGAAAFLPTNQYLVESNKESGKGRFDIALIPKDLTKPGAVLELKAVKDKDEMEAAAKEAYAQIDGLAYTTSLEQQGVTDIVKIGIGFCRRDFEVYPFDEVE